MLTQSLSIIIPVKGKSQSLDVSLNNFSNDILEVIVVNDGCSCQISKMINSFKTKLNIQEVQIKNSKGSYHARNYGAKFAKGEWIVFMDDGIELPSNWKTIVKPYIYKYDYICSNVNIKPSPSEKPIETLFRLSTFPCKTHFYCNDFGITAFLLVKKDTFMKVGGFWELDSGGDFLFGKDTQYMNVKKVFVEELCVFHEPKSKREYIEDIKKYKRGKEEIDKNFFHQKQPNLIDRFIISLKEVVKLPVKLCFFWRDPLFKKSELSLMDFLKGYIEFVWIKFLINIKL